MCLRQDLHRRIDNSRLVLSLEDSQFTYGFNSHYLKNVVSYWRHDFDWKRQVDRLNQYPHFKTTIEGCFSHASPHPAPCPSCPLTFPRVPLPCLMSITSPYISLCPLTLPHVPSCPLAPPHVPSHVPSPCPMSITSPHIWPCSITLPHVPSHRRSIFIDI